ncbi:molybdenum cofactor biosynthesis protein MoaE [Coralloluteibacterium stylophorae]|uniref:Molybdopterin synthase catalytic subunit n=1 Tax=Coralloluteibacterium stylophorae TaxID=1776034 RepID=A0AAP2CBA2_9GAMM|nr:molybdenum cofactor biosynthesis protein MoaE [Coralloluteibacterium stylophorae]MBS7457648.1 molybdenum cofactor biosynthesis protein MoaE [Coralloluteibacterium stylophorae]
MSAFSFAIVDAPLDIAPLRASLLDARAGAFASFEGWVRDHNDGRAVDGLFYEAYAGLANAEGLRVIEEARVRFPIHGARCVHRTGELGIGDMAVWVGVAAGHRDEAFAACRWIIDEIKARVPIWKRERYREGDAGWLHPVPEEREPETGNGKR